MIRPLVLLVGAVLLAGAEPIGPDRAALDALIAGAQRWIVAQQQADGAFLKGGQFTHGITCLATMSLARKPGLGADHPAIVKALAAIRRARQPDGGYYWPSEGLSTYGTSLALLAFAATGSGDPAEIAAAQRCLTGAQNTQTGSPGEGGIGYGDDKAPGHEDMSNTAYAVAALRASGLPASDPALQRAVAFLTRCQDLPSSNDAPWVGKTGPVTGGAVYSPADAQTSWATAEDRSQPAKHTATGALTYQLLSSYLTLDLKPGDPRVDAALAWIAANYRVDGNPGMLPGKEAQGLFHYYALMARTFALLGRSTLALPDGRTADWRADLIKQLAGSAQHARLADGSDGIYWINRANRWGEGIPILTTTYVLGALKGIVETGAPALQASPRP